MKRWIPPRLALAVGVILIVTVVALYKVPTTFNIAATTQVVDAVIGPSHRSPWVFKNAGLFTGSSTQGRSFSGSILALPGVHVTFERIGAGPFNLRFEARPSGGAIAILHEKEGDPPTSISDRVVIIDDAPEKYAAEYHMTVLPISAAMSIGAEIHDATSEHAALLQRGEVSLLGRTLVGGGRFDAGRVMLDLADFVPAEPGTEAYGLLVVKKDPEISVVYRMVAKRLHVYRFGAEGYQLYASVFSRIKNDHALQGIWGASLFILAMLAKWRGGGDAGRQK